MKKIIAVLLTAILAVSLAACGSSGGQSGSNTEDNKENEAAVDIPDAVTLLTTVWDSYTDDEKFPAIGGDFSEANNKENAPGVYDPSDADAVEVNLGFPAVQLDAVDGAASLIHMMNGNTFTCGAFHVKDASQMDNVAAAVKASIMNKQWMCGFPDKLVILTVGDYLVSVYGAEDLVDNFQNHLTAAYASAVVVCDAPIE